ncbi:regulatory protein RecX [Corynebacterium epidermidicanis]|uniref:Regulatory protein RecX n=1 Tax=Corynebacterium epidermidicanis TaxID=1050174 RepID=A0A0G3GUZ0_9CORY|nr:regulatory protein RecX [Corynebacterium epidermidicanis]AKK03348.1 hypothetical protein CEPID_07485 [Corynebacterium epidermidicanis]
MTPSGDKAEKLAQLSEALANFSANGGEPLFDREFEANKATVRNRALRLLDVRSRSHAELRQRLIDAEFEAALVDSVIEDLDNAGLLNDAQFAIDWVRQRHQRRGKSRLALDNELRQKGVGDRERAQALAQISIDDERVKAIELAAKKARTIREAPVDYRQHERALAKIVGVLARRGYPQSMSLDIARNALEQRIAELTEDEQLAGTAANDETGPDTA